MTTSPTPWAPPSRRLRVTLLVFVFLANIFDALATLEFLRHGGQELNPLVGIALEHGAGFFLSWKIVAAAVVCAALAVRSGTHRAAWILLCATAVVYGLLSAYYALGLLLL